MKRYDQTFKRDAVDLLLTSGRPLKALAQELGVAPHSLRYWRDCRFRDMAESAKGDPDAPKDPKALYEQLRALQRENEVLRRQRDILKKALSIISDPPAGSML